MILPRYIKVKNLFFFVLRHVEIHKSTIDIWQTFTPTRSLGSSCKERAVSAEVMFAMKIAMKMRPNRIQMIEKIRATIDFGALSPYLMQKETVINLWTFYMN